MITSAETPAEPPEALEPRRARPEEEEVATQSESGLSTEARDIEEQARTARVLEEGDDLLT